MRITKAILTALVPGLAYAQGGPVNNQGPAVSPDGRQIIFTSNRDGVAHLYLMDAEGGHVRRLTKATVPESFAGWQRDGREAFYSIRDRDTSTIVAVNVATGAERMLGRTTMNGVLMSPDGQTVVGGIGPWGTMQIGVANADGSAERQITDVPGAAHWCSRFANSGDRIATGKNVGSQMQLWIMGSDGSSPRQLTRFTREQGSPQCPHWSADDRTIAFQSSARSQADTSKSAAQIWVVDVATASARLIAPHAEPYLDETPSWFPDGKHLAFQSNRTGSWEIWVMNIDGRAQRQLTR